MSVVQGTLTNENKHLLSMQDLEWNKKKQDMIINLGLNSHSETDQTPTPTRFIRNCEQVGLFQDLQNVNPFDEEFKKAIEHHSGVNQLAIAVAPDETTLHTPKIHPQLEHHDSSKYLRNNVSPPNEYSFTSVVPAIESEDKDSKSGNSLIIDLEKDCEQSLELRKKPGAKNVLVAPMKRLLQKKPDKRAVIHKQHQILQREANAAAQVRCRKKRKNEMDNLQFQNKFLKFENSRLQHVNLYLQETIKLLQEELKEAKQSLGMGSFTKTIQTPFKTPLSINRDATTIKMPNLPVIVPKPTVPLPNSAIGIPLVKNANVIVLVGSQPLTNLITPETVSTRNPITKEKCNRKLITEKLKKRINSK